MAEDERGYHAYLLRIWHMQGDGAARVRATLEDVRTGQRRGFASLPRLFAFLEEIAGPGLAVGTPDPERAEGGREQH